MPDEFITPTEAAGLVLPSLKTVRRAYQSGLLPSYRAPGGRIVTLKRSEVLSFFTAESAARTTSPKPQRPQLPPQPPSPPPTLASRRRPPLKASTVVDISPAGLAERRRRSA